MNRAMGSAEPVADMRADHRDRTRRAILEAFVTILHEDNPSTVSMPAVARRAGVSVRTLYRYFPDKDTLMNAASGWYDVDARDAVGGSLTGDTLRGYLNELWSLLAANIPAVRAEHAGGPGRELRRRRLERSRQELAGQLPPGIPVERRAEVIDMLVAVTSSSMMLELVDRMGHDPERAAGLMARVVELIIHDATDAADAADAVAVDNTSSNTSGATVAPDTTEGGTTP
jgi:AcrR family transcriptional regulator